MESRGRIKVLTWRRFFFLFREGVVVGRHLALGLGLHSEAEFCVIFGLSFPYCLGILVMIHNVNIDSDNKFWEL